MCTKCFNIKSPHHQETQILFCYLFQLIKNNCIYALPNLIYAKQSSFQKINVIVLHTDELAINFLLKKCTIHITRYMYTYIIYESIITDIDVQYQTK